MNRLLTIFTIILLLGCRKNKEYTIEGQMMSSCTTTATSSKEFSLYQMETTLTSIGGYLCDFTCDENGYFKVTYKPENSGKLSIRSNGILIKDIPVKKNINIGKVYTNPPSMNFIVKIKANKSYTNSDTLYYYDWNYPQNGASHWERKIAGPFESEIIDTVQGGSYMKFPLYYNELPILSITYYINSYQDKKDVQFNPSLCSDSFSEAILVIE